MAQQQQIVIGMQFQANVQQAKASLQSLQSTLNQVMKNNIVNVQTGQINEAALAAQSLKMHLKNATLDNGQLDLSKFNASLAKTNQDVTQLGLSLLSSANNGKQAFMGLVQTLSMAQQPVITLNAQMAKLATTFANTARWYLSSNILYGFIGAFQNALTYAKDLNKALVDIRIVSEESTEEMAKFAKQANKSAKSLSTTTTEYAKAALIFYQQGLNSEEVQKRTDITIKMANATAQSVQIVSDQLTAVWNNFYDGSKSLEYYADVMTALGAATASSTDEIATGLEKFAAIAESTGLSYEYATSALATVTATTRQSADVVGTAFKTLFARIQDLELGKTLEDGVSLGKYSEALNVIGINILDANGQLKEMDSILDELGEKWGNLTSAQKASVAQTVAGTRQYTQLIALMDNWDYFQENLTVATTSTGTLNKQAEIYAESWEGASDRVTAAAEKIYGELLNDQAIIGFMNVIADLIGGIGNALEAIGGLKAFIVPALAMIAKIVISKVVPAFSMLQNTWWIMTNQSDKAYQKQVEKTSHMIEQAQVMIHFDTQEAQALEHSINLMQQKAQLASAKSSNSMSQEAIAQAEMELMAIETLTMQYQELEQARQQQEADIRQTYDDQDSMVQNQALRAETKKQILNEDSKYVESKAIQEGQEGYQEAQKYMAKAEAEANSQVTQRIKNSEEYQRLAQDRNKLENQYEETVKKQTKTTNSLNTAQKQYFKTLNDPPVTLQQLGKQAMSLVSSISMGLMGLQMLVSTLKNVDASPLEKATAIMMGLSMIIPAIVTTVSSLAVVWRGLNQMVSFGNALSAKKAIYDQILINNSKKLIASMTAEDLAKKMNISTDQAQLILEALKAYWAVRSLGLSKKKVAALTAEQLSEKTGMALDKAAIVISKLKNGATFKEAIMEAFLTKAKYSGIAANILMQLSMLPMIAIIGILVAALAALAAIIYGVVAAIKAIVKAYNADAIAAKRAAEVAKELAEAYDKCKEKYEAMISAMDNYQSALDALEALTEGTKEYYEALTKANDAALELIQNYSEYFSPEDYRWENGQLIIDKKALEEAEEQASLQLSAAKTAKNVGQTQATILQNKADRTALNRQVRDEMGIGDGDYWWKSMLTVGMVANSINNRQQEFNEVYNKALELAAEDQSLFTDKATMAQVLNIEGQDELINALWENKTQIQNLSTEVKTANELAKVQSRQQAQELLQDKKELQGHTYKDDIIAASGNILSAQVETISQEIIEKSEGWNKGMRSNDEVRELWERYQEASGTNLKLQANAIQGNDDERSIGYYDEENEKKTISIEAVAATVAAHEAAKALGASADLLIAKFADLEAETDEEQRASNKALIKFIGDQSLSGAKKTQFEQLVNNYKGNGDYLAQVLNDGKEIKDATAKSYGFETAAEMEEIFARSVENAQKAWDSIELDDSFIGLGSGMALETAEAFENTVKELNLGPYGEQAGQDFVAGINKMVEGLDQKDTDAALQQLANIDWTSYDALEQAEAIMESFGVEIDTSSQYWKNFAREMRNAAGATPDFSSTISQLQTITKLLKDLEFGGDVSEEDYQSLIDYKNEYADLFMAQADGTRIFIGNVEDMHAASKEMWKDELASIQMYNNLQKQYQENFENGLNYSTGGAIQWGSVKEENQVDALQQIIANWDNGVGAILESRDYSLARIQDLIINQDAEAIQEVFSTMAWVTGSNYDLLTQEVMERMASTVSTLEELQDLLDEGTINKKAFDKGVIVLNQKAKEREKEIERYYTLSKQLENLEREYDRAAAARDRAFGQGALSAINGQLEAQYKIIDNTEQYIAALEADIAKDAAEVNKHGFDIVNGVITNYQQVMNSLGEESREEAEEAISRYEETYSTLLDKQDELAEKEAEIQDLVRENIELQFELTQNITDWQKQTLEWQEELKEFDVSKGWAEALEYQQKILKNSSETYDNNREAAKNLILGQKDKDGNQIFSSEDVEAFFTGDTSTVVDKIGRVLDQETVDSLNNYITAMQEAAVAIKEAWVAQYEAIFDWLEEENEQIDKQLDKFDQLTEKLDFYENVIDIVGKDALGITNEMMEQASKARIEVAKNQVESLRIAKETYEEELEVLKKELAAATKEGDLVGAKLLKEQVEEAEERLLDATSNLQSAIEESLEAVVDAYEKSMERAIETFEKSIYNGMTGDEFEDAFDKQKEISERYVDDYKKVYELSKLTRQINNSIDDTDNIKAKQALRKLEKEIADTQASGTEMSEYDLELLQKKYDLRLAEIALEEAQNAKSTVRLTRDAEGNYSYTYVADQDNISDAEQNYEDKLFALQEFNSNYANEMSDMIVEAQRNMVEDISALRVEDFANEAEYQAKVQEIVDYYTGQMEYYGSEMEKGFNANKELYNTDWKTYDAATQHKIGNNNDFATDFNDTVIGGMKTGITSFEEHMTQFNTSLGTFSDSADKEGKNSLLGNLGSAFKGTQTGIDEVMKAAGTSVETFRSDFEEDVGTADKAGTIIGDSELAKKAIENLADKITNTENGLAAAFKDITSRRAQYTSDMQYYVTETKKYTAALQELYEWMDATGQEVGPKPEVGGTTSGGTDGSGGNPSDPPIEPAINYDPSKGHMVGRVEENESGKKVFKQTNERGEVINIYDNMSQLRRVNVQNEQGEEFVAYQKKYDNVSTENDQIQSTYKDRWLKNWYRINGKWYYEDWVENKNGLYYLRDEYKNSGLAKLDQLVINQEGKTTSAGEKFSALRDLNLEDDMESIRNFGLGNKKFKNRSSIIINGVKYVSFNNGEPYWVKSSDLISNSGTKDQAATSQIPEGIPKYRIIPFDTGGYTGVWGNEGRLAMLHQKELVLNAQDTENFLVATDILRDIVSSINLNSLSSQLSSLIASGTIGSTNTVDQNVHIEATFPNVTDHNEIEQALITLINDASQYAFRR